MTPDENLIFRRSHETYRWMIKTPSAAFIVTLNGGDTLKVESVPGFPLKVRRKSIGVVILSQGVPKKAKKK